MAVFTEVRQVVRRLQRSPMFTFVTLLTIAVGVGANSAVFSVLNGVLLQPLPYPEPDSLVALWQTAPRLNLINLEASPSDYFTFLEENRSFQSLDKAICLAAHPGQFSEMGHSLVKKYCRIRRQFRQRNGAASQFVQRHG